MEKKIKIDKFNRVLCPDVHVKGLVNAFVACTGCQESGIKPCDYFIRLFDGKHKYIVCQK
jgi:hypothetical protein